MYGSHLHHPAKFGFETLKETYKTPSKTHLRNCLENKLYREYCCNNVSSSLQSSFALLASSRTREGEVRQKIFTVEKGLPGEYRTNRARKFHAWQMKKHGCGANNTNADRQQNC